MPHRGDNQFKRFQRRVESIKEAQVFFDAFYRKFGNFAGRNYLCSETATEGPEDGPYLARIGLIPWPYPIEATDRVDFDSLIQQTSATEIVN